MYVLGMKKIPINFVQETQISVKVVDMVNNKTVLLRTYEGETLVSVEPVSVPEEWQQYMGPYIDMVPFCVGSNQELIELEDGEAPYSYSIDPPILPRPIFPHPHP